MGKDAEPQVTTTQVEIPAFLRPFMNQAAGIGQSALGNLQNMLGGATAKDLVAGFTPAQIQAFDLAQQFATGQTPFLPTAQNVLLQAAQGGAVPQSALQALSGATGAQLLPQASLQALTQAGLSPSAVDPIAAQALQSTAGGNFLFGGSGFDEAVQAAVRAAAPAITSTFGRAGAGAATGGLARAAIGQAAIDAFARQFAQERANQLGAAGTLANLGLAGRQQQLGALSQLADVNQAQTVAQLQAAGLLGNLGLAQTQQQMAAAQLLPQLGLLGSDVLSRIGAQQQAQAQQQLTAPITAQQQLLQTALMAPGAFGPLFGQTTTVPTQSNPLGGALGGALAGFSMFGPIGALGGGVLGLLGS